MTLENSEVYKIWALRISLAVAVIVIILSWLNKVRIPYILIRGAVSFGVMYLLLAGSLYLFEKTALPEEPEEQDELPNPDAGRGEFIDASIGDDVQPQGQELKPDLKQGRNQAFGQEQEFGQDQDVKSAGQVDPGLSEGLPDGERQAEIVRRMGWEE